MGKAGRKKRVGVKRTAKGAISRAKAAYAEHLPQVAVRMAKYGLGEDDARDPKAGTVVGRLRLAKVLGEHEYAAALRLLDRYDAFKRAVKSPGLVRTGSSEAGELSSDEYAEWCSRAISGYEMAVDVVRSANNVHRGRNLFAAIDYLVFRDEDFIHMRDDLKLALSALAEHFGLTDSEEMAA